MFNTDIGYCLYTRGSTLLTEFADLTNGRYSCSD